MMIQGYTEKDGIPSYELLDSLSNQVLMEIALFIGVVHLFFGMIRYVRRHKSYIGWMIFLVGGYLYFPVFLGAYTFVNYWLGISSEKAGPVGLHLIYIGIAVAMILAIIKNGIAGLEDE